MIVLVHNNSVVTAIRKEGIQQTQETNFIGKPIISVLLELTDLYPDRQIGWIHEALVSIADFQEWKTLLHHPLELIFFEPTKKHYMSPDVEYIDMFSPFVNRNAMQKVRYATWMASSSAGLAHAGLIKMCKSFAAIDNFRLFLVMVARLGMNKGLLPYSEPRLIPKQVSDYHPEKIKAKDFFSFIKNVHGEKWVFYYLLLNKIYGIKKGFGWLDYVKAPKYGLKTLDFIRLQEQIKKLAANENDTIDVLIPTLGRKKYLYDVLKDLSVQTHLPNSVVIVEQNPDKNAVSELDYLTSEVWPFDVKHTFTHQLGACNARNIGINQIEAAYTFFADDDIRIGPKTLFNAISTMKTYSLSATTLAVYQHGEYIKPCEYPVLWGTFGTGSSIVDSVYAKKTFFDMALEFGYGEDKDYGDSLRTQGCSITYLASDPMMHLKAPVGGFRFKFDHPWAAENPLPKPSPTVMYNMMKNSTKRQIRGYKLYHFLKRIGNERPLNLIAFLKQLRHQWTCSEYWAQELVERGNK